MFLQRCRVTHGTLRNVFTPQSFLMNRYNNRFISQDIESNQTALTRLLTRSIANSNFEDAEYIMDHMIKKKMVPAKENYENLIYTFTRLNDPVKVGKYVTGLKEAGYSLDITMINNLIKIYIQIKDYALASKTFYQSIKLNILPNIKTFEILFTSYLETKQYGSLLALVPIMYDSNIKPNRPIYNALFQAYVKAHKPNEVLHLLSQMKANRIFPTQDDYIEAIKFFIDFGYIDHALQITSLPELALSSDAYCQLIRGYLDCDCLSSAEAAFREMRNRKIKINTELCKWFIKYYIENNDVKVAFRFFNVLPSSFKQVPTLYIFVINVLLQNNYGKEVSDIYKKFESKFSIPNSTNMYNALIGKALLNMEDNKADEYLRIMKSKKIPVNIDTYDYFLKHYTRSKLAFTQWPQIEEIMDNIATKKLTPSSDTFYYIVRYAILCNDHVRAESYLKILLNDYPDVSPYKVYNVMLEFYSTVGTTISQMLIEQLVDIARTKPNRDVFNSIIAGYTAYGDIENSIRYYDQLVRHQITPNRKTLTLMIKVCCKHSFINEATKYFTMMKTELSLDPITENYNDLIYCCARVGDMKNALKYFNKLTSLNLKPTKPTFDHIIAGYYRIGQQKWGDNFASELNIVVDKQKMGADYFKNAIL